MSFFRRNTHIPSLASSVLVLASFLVSSSFSPVLGVDLVRGTQAHAEYHVGPSDVLEITVFGEDDLTREVQVTASGYIMFPLLGRLRPVGLTVEELEDFITTKLAKDFIRNPQVSVFIKEFSSIYVLGQVNEPGRYPYTGGLTLLEAISTAGGFSPIANKRKVRVVRNRGERRKALNFNAHNISTGRDQDVLVIPGDKIIVGESFF
jgi:polysaccharide biosynthesis/export protein